MSSTFDSPLLDLPSSGFDDRYSSPIKLARRIASPELKEKIKNGTLTIKDVNALIKIAKLQRENLLVRWLRNRHVDLQ